MAKREFTIEYDFVSTRADGDNYTLRIAVKASSVHGAMSIAKIEGFSHFGARFNDNCVDWRVINN